MIYTRKTKDVWDFYVNYGQGWEYETRELTRDARKENIKAYRENCSYPLKVVQKRIKINSDN